MELFFGVMISVAVIFIIVGIVQHNRNKENTSIAENVISNSGFTPTATKIVRGYRIMVDEQRQEWLVLPPDGNYRKIMRFNELVSCEVDEIGDHNTTTGIFLRITTTDFNNSCINIPIISSPILARQKYNKEGIIHDAGMREAHEAVSFMMAIKARAAM